jgi:hypothetical protein
MRGVSVFETLFCSTKGALIQINFVASAWMSRDFSARFVQGTSLLLALFAEAGAPAN